MANHVIVQLATLNSLSCAHIVIFYQCWFTALVCF